MEIGLLEKEEETGENESDGAVNKLM